MGGGKDKHNEEEKGVFSHLAHGVAQAAHGYPPGAYPPHQGYPPGHGYPPQGGYPPAGYPPAGYPPAAGGYPPAGYHPHGYPGSSAPHGMIPWIFYSSLLNL